MLFITPQNVTDAKVTVTSTATLLYGLMDTASSVSTSRKYYNDRFANALIINPEDGDIRYMINATPTATTGILVSSGSKEYLPGLAELDALKIIRVGSSDVACTVIPYRSEPGESPANVAYDVTLEAGEVTIGDVSIVDNTTGVPAGVDANERLAVRNFSQLVTVEYDYISLSYTGDNLTTVVYKTGGSGGATVATLTLAYTGSVLDSVTKS